MTRIESLRGWKRVVSLTSIALAGGLSVTACADPSKAISTLTSALNAKGYDTLDTRAPGDGDFVYATLAIGKSCVAHVSMQDNYDNQPVDVSVETNPQLGATAVTSLEFTNAGALPAYSDLLAKPLINRACE